MINCELKSSVKLQSNVALQLNCTHYEDKQKYLPFDLLGQEYNDVRLSNKLTEHQSIKHEKMLYYAKNIISDNTKYSDTHSECSNCKYKDICV